MLYVVLTMPTLNKAYLFIIYYKSKFIQAHTDIKRLLQILIESYFPRSITRWNRLPTTFTTADTVDGFKSMIPVSASQTSYLLQSLYYGTCY
jgi:hypothetical protein